MNLDTVATKSDGSAGPPGDPSEDRQWSFLRTAALVMGASFFAYLFGVFVHEVGHYSANLVLGVPEPGIVLHPFDLNENLYGGDTSQALGTPLRLAFDGAAGPMLNLLLGVGVSLFAWRKRSPLWLPLLMWGPLALVVEGVGMIIGLIDNPDLVTDWVKVIMWGVPPVVIGLSAVVLLVSGYVWLQLLLPLMGFRAEDPPWRILSVQAAGTPTLLMGAVIYLALVGSNSTLPDMVMQNRVIALIASSAFVTVIALFYRSFFPLLDRISHTRPMGVSWRGTVPALGLGTAVFVFQLVFFNY